MCNCDQDNQPSDSGFILGLVIGAIIGAIVAVLIYKNNKSVVFSNLKLKLEKYFKDIIPSESKFSPKIPVVLPSKIIASSTVQKSTTPKPTKMFVKPKK